MKTVKETTTAKQTKDKNFVICSNRLKEFVLKYRNIIIAVIAIIVISGVGVLCKVINSSSVNLTAYFSSSSKGYNPDGSPYKVEEILSAQVLEEAVKKLDGKVTVEYLKRHLSVSDGMSYEAMEKAKTNIKDGKIEYTDIPTTYTLTFSTVSDRIKNEGFISSCSAVFKKMLAPSKRKMLIAVAESYSEYYKDKYISGLIGLELDWEHADKLDYYNKASRTEAIARKLNRFITEKYTANPIFVSESSKIGYGDLQTRLSQITAVDIENYKSYIILNGITKDRPELLRQFRYMDKLYQEINRRELVRYDAIKEAISFYDANVTKVVFIPSLDYSNSFYMNRTKVGIDYLVEDANISKTSADEAQYNSEECKYLINNFTDNEEATEEVYANADKLYNEIKKKINGIAEEAAVVITEETELEKSQKIEVGGVYISMGLISMAVSGAKTFIVLMLILFLAVTFSNFINKKTHLKGKEGGRA